MSTVMIWQTLSTSSAETEKLGSLLGNNLSGGEIIELRSDLGGGKTTFVKGVVNGAGSKDSVTSPTFTLSRIYTAKNFGIHHFDFYRLDEPGILADQLAESINNKHVVVVEWADIVKDVLPANHISIELRPSVNSSDERRITISYTQNHQRIIAAVESEWSEVKP